MVLIGLIALFQIGRGSANLGVDFSGGSLLQYKAEQPFSMAEVRAVFTSNGMEGINLQEVENENRLIIKVKKSEAVVANLWLEYEELKLEALKANYALHLAMSEIGQQFNQAQRQRDGLQRQVELTERDRRGVGTQRLAHGDPAG